MNNAESIATLKYLANMSIQSDRDVKQNQHHYHFSDDDIFKKIDHRKAQISFQQIARAYFTAFNGKKMHLENYAFQEYHGTYEINFAYNFDHPQCNFQFLVRLTNQDEYQIYTMTSGKFQSKNGTKAFREVRADINNYLKDTRELEEKFS